MAGDRSPTQKDCPSWHSLQIHQGYCKWHTPHAQQYFLSTMVWNWKSMRKKVKTHKDREIKQQRVKDPETIGWHPQIGGCRKSSNKGTAQHYRPTEKTRKSLTWHLKERRKEASSKSEKEGGEQENNSDNHQQNCNNRHIRWKTTLTNLSLARLTKKREDSKDTKIQKIQRIYNMPVSNKKLWKHHLHLH